MLQLRVEPPSILIVDDEPQVATALADVLEGCYRVLTETSPAVALELLESDKRISVIISDQRMPGMTGDELFARARKVSIATRILVTAYADISAVIDAVNQGKIFAYVTKPWRPDDIILTVKRAVDYCSLNRKILHEQALLHQLMESSLDAIAIKDRDHKYIKLNGPEARMLGTADGSLAEGRTAADFLPPRRSQARQREEAELLRTGMPMRDRVEEVTAADRETRWYSSNMAPIRDLQGDIVGLVRITRDITESKRLDRMKDQFIAAVRHELRTPLTAIHGALGLLRGVPGKPDRKTKRLVEIGYHNSGKLLSLVNDLLDTVSLERGELRFDRTAVGIADIVKGAIAAMAGEARRRDVAILADCDLPQIQVEADGERLQQALAKLLANAIEVSRPGSKVDIQARATEGRKVRLAVLDQGPGVPEEFRARIFERFSQADSSSTRAKGGVGLGLYIAKSIIEAHHGTIGFANRDGQGGAEFFFELPILEMQPSVKGASAKP